MNVEQFERALRQYMYRKPFEAFLVELFDGTLIEIDTPNIGFGGGDAGFFNPRGELVEFSCEEVREFRPVVRGIAS
jgi:hypothetical protein